ncbi:methyltransferase domain-containing protein [Gramella sp. KN1008]|nr:methyltransferase domain-containing protein [Gramella sp. KN1008]
MKSVNSEFWSARYRENKTGWDIGHVSTPIKEYIDQLGNKELKILIPGAGNSYEAEYLFTNGFTNVFICDIVPEPIENFKKRVPGFPKVQLIQKDFFSLTGTYDLILEQTFFCAIPVERRAKYARKCHDLLSKDGRIAGVFFEFKLTGEGPPFGGSREEYLTYFSKYFKIDILERCYNSIKPRQGNELFFKFIKN